MKAGGKGPEAVTKRIYAVSIMCQPRDPKSDEDLAACMRVLGHTTGKLPYSSQTGLLPNFDGQSNYEADVDGTGMVLQQVTAQNPKLFTSTIEELTKKSMGLASMPQIAVRSTCTANMASCLDPRTVASMIDSAFAMICWHTEEKQAGAASSFITDCMALPQNIEELLGTRFDSGLFYPKGI